MSKKARAGMRIFALLAAAAGAGVSYRTKSIQKKAREKGVHVPYGPYEAAFKRPMDAILSSFALLALSPLIMGVALMVKKKSGPPVFFFQQRAGLDGHVFQIVKFRTMADARGADGRLLSDEERLTAFGKWLRGTSLDELPELLNIVRGEMSIVGPRPLLAEYLPRYSSRQKQRHDVRPGLTGLAQVSGRNGLSWNEKFEKDVQYAEKITFLGDLKILADTVSMVIHKTGISSGTSATMEVFMGNEQKPAGAG